MKPMAAALTGALIAGVGMYAIGAHAQDGFAMNPALAGYPAMSFNTAMPQPLAQPVAYAPVYAPASRPVAYRPAAAPRPAQTVYRSTEPRIVSQTVDTRPQRSTTKTALVIGGSAATVISRRSLTLGWPVNSENSDGRSVNSRAASGFARTSDIKRSPMMARG